MKSREYRKLLNRRLRFIGPWVLLQLGALGWRILDEEAWQASMIFAGASMAAAIAFVVEARSRGGA